MALYLMVSHPNGIGGMKNVVPLRKQWVPVIVRPSEELMPPEATEPE
jgi:hypothetical protein